MMDGGLMMSPPTRFTGFRLGQFQQRAPRPESTYTFNFRAPSVPGQGAGQSCDGKKPRTKVVTRKTVDYNSTVCSFVQNRIWQRDHRDVRSVQPDSLYFPSLRPPADMLEHPLNCVVTKHVRTASNKVRCPVFCVCWTPEGRRLITGASSGEFTLWNGLTFSFETILQAHDSAVRCMMWSHNEQWLLSGDHGGYVKYWQLNMNNVKMYQAHKDPVRGLSFSPTDQKYTSCSDDGTVRIWDFLRCHEERIFRGHGADVKCVDWHPTKGLIASGSRDNQQPLILWDPRMGQKLSTVHAHKHTVMEVKFNRNGNWLLTASRDHLIKLFDIRNFKEEMQSFKGHMKEATTVAWHPIHESLFASGGSDGQVMFWLVGHEREVGNINEAHDSLIWSATWHPLGHILVTGSNDHNTKFWTRNRPGDGMRDQYNLNTLPPGSDENPDFVDELKAVQKSTPSLTLPGTNMDYLASALKATDTQKTSGEAAASVIPGLDFSGVSDQPEEQPEEESKDTKRKTPFAKHIPRDFVRAWTDGKQPEIISQQLEQNESGKPKPPSLLDLPLQVPTKMMDSKQQEESLPQQHMQPQEEVYNEEADYPQQEEEMPSKLTLPGLGGPVPKELPKGSLLGDWPGDDDTFRTSKNQAFNFDSFANQQKAPLLPKPQQGTNQNMPITDLNKFYNYQSAVDIANQSTLDAPSAGDDQSTPVLKTGVAKKPDLSAFYNYEEDPPVTPPMPMKTDRKRQGATSFKNASMGKGSNRKGPNPGFKNTKNKQSQGFRNSNKGEGFGNTSQGQSYTNDGNQGLGFGLNIREEEFHNSQGQEYSNVSQDQGNLGLGQTSDMYNEEVAQPTGFHNTEEGYGENQLQEGFNQGRRKTSYKQDKFSDFRNQGNNTYNRNSTQFNAHRSDSGMDNSFNSAFDQDSAAAVDASGFHGNGKPERDTRGSWSGSQPVKRGFNEGPGEDTSPGDGDWNRGPGFKSRGGRGRGSSNASGVAGRRGGRGGGGSSSGRGGGHGSGGSVGGHRGGRGQRSRGRPG